LDKFQLTLQFFEELFEIFIILYDTLRIAQRSVESWTRMHAYLSGVHNKRERKADKLEGTENIGHIARSLEAIYRQACIADGTLCIASIAGAWSRTP